MKILVLGGNRFFGKILVQNLLTSGHKVTLLNRGNIEHNFDQDTQMIKCDRKDTEQLHKLVGHDNWDVVFDQICYDYEDAKNAVNIFKGRVGKYIFTSSISVYEGLGCFQESDFVPQTYKINNALATDVDYAEGKRQAEAGFFEDQKFPVAALRFPIVIGQHDYTERFKFHVEHIKNSQKMCIPNVNAKIAFISSEDAAHALWRLADSNFVGPINVTSRTPIVIKHFLEIIHNEVGGNILITPRDFDAGIIKSPYAIESDWYMNCDLLKTTGVHTSAIEKWLPKITKYYL